MKLFKANKSVLTIISVTVFYVTNERKKTYGSNAS
jgi:hypothetical protein